MTTPINSFRGEYHFLSNFYPFAFTWNGITYPTLEHIFQASKTENQDERAHIAACGTPGMAKRMGRKVSPRPDWDRIKIALMYELLSIKFSDPNLRDLLLQTGDATLIEGNDWGDTFWGRVGGVGANWMGVLLMLARSRCGIKEAG